MTTRHRHDRPDPLEELLRLTPVRERPPAHDTASVRDAVHAAWRLETRPRRLAPVRLAWAAAAVLAISVTVMILRQPGVEPGPATTLARVDAVSGEVQSLHSGRSTPLAAGGVLSAAQQVTLSPGAHLALSWTGGIRLRFDQGSSFEALSSGEFHLSGGRVYVDTDDADPGASLSIVTAEGSIRHIGTRYQVRANANMTEVLVREGRVSLQPAGSGDSGATEAQAGQRLSADRGGRVSIADAPTWGDAWSWIDETTTPFNGDGRTVVELLEWTARESGRVLVFTPPSLRSEANEVQLHGDLALGVDDALSVINATTNFRARIEDERIEVSIERP